jgi:hypothetical protein
MNYATTKQSRAIPRGLGQVTSAGEVRKLNARKQKKLMTIRQRIRNWLYADQESDMAVEVARDDDDDLRIDHDMALHFSVIPAAGGKIVRIQYYDRAKDRNINKLSIITPDENLAESLAQILQIEMLSR